LLCSVGCRRRRRRRRLCRWSFVCRRPPTPPSSSSHHHHSSSSVSLRSAAAEKIVYGFRSSPLPRRILLSSPPCRVRRPSCRLVPSTSLLTRPISFKVWHKSGNLWRAFERRRVGLRPRKTARRGLEGGHVVASSVIHQRRRVIRRLVTLSQFLSWPVVVPAIRACQ